MDQCFQLQGEIEIPHPASFSIAYHIIISNVYVPPTIATSGSI